MPLNCYMLEDISLVHAVIYFSQLQLASNYYLAIVLFKIVSCV